MNHIRKDTAFLPFQHTIYGEILVFLYHCELLQNELSALILHQHPLPLPYVDQVPLGFYTIMSTEGHTPEDQNSFDIQKEDIILDNQFFSK